MKAHQQNHRLLGIAGNGGTGKDTVASILETHGFVHISSSDVLREEIKQLGLACTRATQTEVANRLRKSHGADFLIRKSMELAPADDSVVISGVYAPAEADFIKNRGGKLIFVTREELNQEDLAQRYGSILLRADGSRDNISLHEFTEAHQRENSGQEPCETNVSLIRPLADFVINNNGSLGDLKQTVERLIIR